MESSSYVDWGGAYPDPIYFSLQVASGKNSSIKWVIVWGWRPRPPSGKFLTPEDLIAICRHWNAHVATIVNEAPENRVRHVLSMVTISQIWNLNSPWDVSFFRKEAADINCPTKILSALSLEKFSFLGRTGVKHLNLKVLKQSISGIE